METVYKCDFCDKTYYTKKECNECEESHYDVSQLAGLCDYVIKYTYPRLKRMAWYREELKEKKDRLLVLMKLFLQDKIDSFDDECAEMYKLFGELLPYMWN